MAVSTAEKFLESAEKKVFDPEHRRKLSFNIGQYDKKVVEGKKQFSDLELARERASALKTKKGTKVERAQEVGKSIAAIAKEKNITSVVFDRGGFLYAGRVKALADAAREAGLKF
jgi:ribosomal protein L18